MKVVKMPSGRIPVEVECLMCHKFVTLQVPRLGYEKWQAGTLIQDALPQLSPSERELLISKTCDKCFEKLFKGGDS